MVNSYNIPIFAAVNRQGYIYNHIIKKVSVMLIVMFAALVVNNALFTHMHKTASGQWITHAHPFSKDSQKKHTHTDQELCFYQQIQIYTEASECNPEPTELLSSEYHYLEYTSSIDCVYIDDAAIPRAPPVLDTYFLV
ncbi:hypothetical protein DMA11_04080 [Marinilabiliaceae bacterium JC017]|nr:hypothetical protein DMA11_04080 [Marinilabiliaceae bacterium JC017]